MNNLFSGIYKNKTVLVTGHTGFKGSWLAYWLTQMGAKVIGYSIDIPTIPNHISLMDLDIVSIEGDIRDLHKLNQTFQKFQPDIVFHLAAQALVKKSYQTPIDTYETNVMGTLKILEACRTNNVKAIVNITSDKAYENKETIWGYREHDPLGGYDPYSSSKGCADILVNSYRNSYFNINDYKNKHNTLIASCRAGNVIGGGDWAKDRLLVDIMVSGNENKKVVIRNPNSTRPWQHVLEPLSGYLCIGQKLLEENKDFSDAWNFGPIYEQNITVEDLLQSVKEYWNKIEYELNVTSNNEHEANLLKLDCSKANTLLKWTPVWNSDETFERTVTWYKSYYENNTILTKDDLTAYVKDAKKRDIVWTK